MSGSKGITYDKYPSTPHLTWSPEKHRDDSYHPDVRSFEGEKVVITEKMDGENLNIYPDGSWHARSIETPYHPTREWAGRVAGELGYKLPDDWKICAENLYGTHSIKYTDLRSYVQVYGIVNSDNRFLSWDDTMMWCELLDLDHTPVLYKGTIDFYKGSPVLHTEITEDGEREVIDLAELTEEEINERAGRTSEGYVMRIRDSFPVEQFEFNVGKWVRENHVQTDEHWLRAWEKEDEKNELQDDNE